jgi:apolipoprotein D and lipocalin family protein
MKLFSAACALVVASSLGAPALAGAPPQPTRPAPVNLYSGRWYEIARTNNKMQADCLASTTDFSGWRSGAFSAVQTCHKGAVSGPTTSVTVQGHVLPSSRNAKIQLAMLGGLITSDGRYIWLMSRQPVIAPAVKAAAVARMQLLGLNLTRLIFPQQLARQ